MIQFSTRILRFDKKGEKTGWSYIEIGTSQAQKLNPDCKVSFRVKGKLDQYTLEKAALLPMGDGSFILPINGKIRKALQKNPGDTVHVTIQLDKRTPTLSKDFMDCLKEDPDALTFFKTLPRSHQQYFSNWIESAKTTQTKTKRIVMAITGLSNKQGYGEMIRANKSKVY